MILHDVVAAVRRAAEVLARPRATGVRIVHVAHARAPGELFDRSAARGAFVAGHALLPGEVVVEKAAPLAFTGTNLADVLDAAGAASACGDGRDDGLVCLLHAAFAAELGHACCVMGGSCAARDLPLADGGVVPAAVVHAANLRHSATGLPAWCTPMTSGEGPRLGL